MQKRAAEQPNPLIDKMRAMLRGDEAYFCGLPVVVQAATGHNIPRWRFKDDDPGRAAVVVPGALHKIAPVHREPMYLIPSEFFLAAKLAGSITLREIEEAMYVQLDRLFEKMKAAADDSHKPKLPTYFAGMNLNPPPALAECFYLTYRPNTYRHSIKDKPHLFTLDDGRVFGMFSLTLGPDDLLYRPTFDPDWTMNIGPG